MRRELAVAGPAPPEVVWGRYVDLDQWAAWAPFITRVEATARELGAGLTGVVHGPLGVQAVFAVEMVNAAARSWRWSVRSGPLRMRLGHEVLARSGGGTVATLDLEGPAVVVLGYSGPATLALRRLVAS